MVMPRLYYGSASEHFGDLRRPAGSDRRPLVVLIHGGFWRDQYRLDLMDPLADDLAKRGYASWNIEYRRVGPTGGGWFTTLDDVAAAIDHIVSVETPPAIAVVGHSAGGHLALWNAGRTRPKPAATPALTVGLAAVSDVVGANKHGVGRDATTNFVGGSVTEFAHRYTHVQPGTEPAGRVLLVHGDADENVPVTQSTNTTGRLRVDRLEVVEGADHFDVIDPNHHSWAVTVAELDRLR